MIVFDKLFLEEIEIQGYTWKKKLHYYHAVGFSCGHALILDKMSEVAVLQLERALHQSLL